jgi:hypothetical protein
MVQLGDGTNKKPQGLLEQALGDQTIRRLRQTACDKYSLPRKAAQSKGSFAMPYILKREKQIEILRHLVEGNTLRSTSRLAGVHRTTIQNLLVTFGSSCQDFMDRELRSLTLNHVEVDEVWTFVGKKQARLTLDERATRSDIGDVYLWTALDAETKLVASHLVGKRSADNARRLM